MLETIAPAAALVAAALIGDTLLFGPVLAAITYLSYRRALARRRTRNPRQVTRAGVIARAAGILGVAVVGSLVAAAPHALRTPVSLTHATDPHLGATFAAYLVAAVTWGVAFWLAWRLGHTIADRDPRTHVTYPGLDGPALGPVINQPAPAQPTQVLPAQSRPAWAASDHPIEAVGTASFGGTR